MTRASDFDVAIVGGGFGGLGAALRLRRSGVRSFVLLEKASTIGGTWRDNTYPGCCCDVPGLLYWYSTNLIPIEEQPDWTHVYPAQDEILANLQALVDKQQLRSHIQCNTAVTEMAWQDDRWALQCANGETYTAKLVVSSAGQLSRPTVPSIPGQSSFGGTQFHSAAWPADLSVKGKRVGCIGSGATAVQIVPAIADQVQQLVLFQRTPNYIFPRMDRAYTEDERRLFRDPAIRSQVRKTCHEWQESWFRAFASQGPLTERAGMTDTCRQHLENQIHDRVLREKLWPDYPFGCKRPLLSDDFYPALTRSNVALVTDKIESIGESGLRTHAGNTYDLDVIVYCTGFETQSFVGPVSIRGPRGTLGEVWRNFPETFMGTMVGGFPNFFLLYGPNTNLSHNSVILMIEAQIEFFLECRNHLVSEGAKTIEVSESALREFCETRKDGLDKTVWSGTRDSWYKNDRGDITTQWYGTVDDYTTKLKLDPGQMILGK